jgi:hypothetical protein
LTRPECEPLVVRLTLRHRGADEAAALRELRAILTRLLRWGGWRFVGLEVMPDEQPPAVLGRQNASVAG